MRSMKESLCGKAVFSKKGNSAGYMEYHGDLVRHSLLKYWYDIGTEFHGCGTELSRRDQIYTFMNK